MVERAMDNLPIIALLALGGWYLFIKPSTAAPAAAATDNGNGQPVSPQVRTLPLSPAQIAAVNSNPEVAAILSRINPSDFGRLAYSSQGGIDLASIDPITGYKIAT